MSLYREVRDLVEDLEIDEMVSMDQPVKLKAFRKFLSEIGKANYKRFTTKIVGDQLHIMRINYHSITKELNANDN